jgi:hypothetical protein
MSRKTMSNQRQKPNSIRRNIGDIFEKKLPSYKYKRIMRKLAIDGTILGVGSASRNFSGEFRVSFTLFPCRPDKFPT